MNQIPLLISLLVFAWLAIQVILSVSREREELRAELNRWRVGWQEARRWLAEFPEVSTALEHLKDDAEGTGGADISSTREAMRQRRARTTITLSPAEIQSGHDRVRWAEGLIQQLPADHEGRNSWLMNYAREGIEYAKAGAEPAPKGFTDIPRDNLGGWMGGA